MASMNSVGRGMEYWTLTITGDIDVSVDPALQEAVNTAVATLAAAEAADPQVEEDITAAQGALTSARAALDTRLAAVEVAKALRAKIIQTIGLRGQPIILGDFSGQTLKFAMDVVGGWSTEVGAKNNIVDAFVSNCHVVDGEDVVSATVTAVSTKML